MPTHPRALLGPGRVSCLSVVKGERRQPPHRHVGVILLLSLVSVVFVGPVFGQQDPGAVSQPITVWSEGTRLAGSLWRPAGIRPEDRLAAILLAHGWGGLRSQLDRSYAPKFAAAGFVVLSFDYRGWGDSDGKLVTLEKQARPSQAGELSVRARVIRQVVDPFDQIQDLSNALHYLAGEAQVDSQRIGIWGTSYGGGHAIYLAAHDPRIRAIVAQVGAQKPENAERWAGLAQARATAKARGTIDPIPQGIDQIPGLAGTPDLAKMIHYRPIDHAPKIRVPTLFIDVDREELFDRIQHGYAAYQIVRHKAPAEYKLYPGTHYSIYREHYAAAADLALGWFVEHLRAEKSAASATQGSKHLPPK